MAKKGKPQTSKGLAVFCARLAEQKIAKDIIMLNLSKIDASPANYFVICTCDSENQMRAIVDATIEACRDFGVGKPKVEGAEGSKWILLDFFDVVVHIMLREAREFYKLERLWGDAQFFSLNEEGSPRVIKQNEQKAVTV